MSKKIFVDKSGGTSRGEQVGDSFPQRVFVLTPQIVLPNITNKGLPMTKKEMRMKAEELIDHLPDDTSWDDLMYTIYVRQKIEKGISDADNGRTISTDELRRKFQVQ